MATQNEGTTNAGIMIAGATAAALAAAGAYLFYGSGNAAKNRKTARSWMLKARTDVLDAVENAVQKVGEIDKAAYLKIISDIVGRSSTLAAGTTEEIAQLTKDLQGMWNHMQKARKTAVAKVKKVASKKGKK